MNENNVITWDALSQLLESENEFGVLGGFQKNQWEQLHGIARSICRIKTFDSSTGIYSTGTGFYMGGGWIMTNQHVIFEEESLRFLVSEATFYFQSHTFEKRKRSFICPDFKASDETSLEREYLQLKDLCLIHVSELETLSIPGLQTNYVVCEEILESFNSGKDVPVCLIHYGEDEYNQCPLQLSVGNILKINHKKQNGINNQYVEHSTYSPEGSSGSPLLAFSVEQEKFFVCAVHAEGPLDDRTGDALLYHGSHWIQSTLRAASDICSRRFALYEQVATNVSSPEISRSIIKTRNELLKTLDEALRQNELRAFLAEDVVGSAVAQDSLRQLQLNNVEYVVTE